MESNRPSWAQTEGLWYPRGVSWIEHENAYNFVLYSKFAESVTLLLYRETDLEHPCFQYSLDYLKNKTGRTWHCRIPKPLMGDARYYAYSVSGPTADGPREWHAFNPGKILLDPYAQAIFFPPAFSRDAARSSLPNPGSAPLGVIAASHRNTFDWTGAPHPRHESDLVIYEMHVKSFTADPSSGVDADKRGTYSGVIQKIPYLLTLGITAVELMPIFQYDPQEGSCWGYMPLSFFAPHMHYAASGNSGGQADEFREMVKALHLAGIEVILDVVYNHTCEGDETGPTYGYKGIDNITYYMKSSDPSHPYANYSGTGNTLNCANRYVRRLILDSMRYWVREMHVDGFRFDLASIYSRNEDGSINFDDPPIFGAIFADPDFAGLRLIAEPWDTLTFQLGQSFPGLTWFQWNGRFRDDIRKFVRGDQGMISTLMQRIYGSDDLFPGDRVHAYHPYQSINYISSHDGFTLYDLVSYNQKQNWVNGHHNQDGMDDNFSWNCGSEGDRGLHPTVLALRVRQVKNFCCLLLLSSGTPMFRAGDEFLKTQFGNNNPYNQDNPTTWLDWDKLREHQESFRFFQRMIAFRKHHPSLSRSRFWRGDVHWHGTGEAVDLSPDSRALAFCLLGTPERDDDLYVMINGSYEPAPFTVQDCTDGPWARIVDTGISSPFDFLDLPEPLSSTMYRLEPRSIVVLVRKRSPR